MNKEYKLCTNIISVMFYLKHKASNNIGLNRKPLEKIVEELNFSINTTNGDELISILNIKTKEEYYHSADLSYLSNFYSNILIDLLKQLDIDNKSKIFFDLILKSNSYNTFLDAFLNNLEYKQFYLSTFHKYKYLQKLKVSNIRENIYGIIQLEFNKRKI